jgi:hypothetical protein
LIFDGVNPDLGYKLLQAFWNRQHCSGNVVYRPSFMRDMACRGRYFNDLLLNAMKFVAYKHVSPQASPTPGFDVCVSGMTFRKRAEESLYRADTQLLTRSSITTIQALLLMSDALFAWCDERSLSWQYLGIAINMIMDLGIHTTQSGFYQHGLAEQQEIGRRVFWSAYSKSWTIMSQHCDANRYPLDADKVQSIYQGRPVRLRNTECSVSMSFLDEYEELELFESLTYSATPRRTDTSTRSVSINAATCKLSILAELIIEILYAEKSSLRDGQALLEAATSLKAELELWRSSLPTHLDLKWEDLGSFDILPHSLSLM